MILPGVELKIFDLGVGELPPGLTLNRGGKMTKISSWGGKFFFSLAVLKSCPCMLWEYHAIHLHTKEIAGREFRES